METDYVNMEQMKNAIVPHPKYFTARKYEISVLNSFERVIYTFYSMSKKKN